MGQSCMHMCHLCGFGDVVGDMHILALVMWLGTCTFWLW